MAFDWNPNRSEGFRFTLSERDRAYASNCKTCSVQKLCGGWSVYNDARWCDGPGEVCWTSCRAICSRNPEKVSWFAGLLGGEARLNSLTGLAEPDLNIVGRHPWTPWQCDWPDVGFQYTRNLNNVYQPLYIMSLKLLYYPATGGWSPQKDIRKRYSIPPEALVVLSMAVIDTYLDALERDLNAFADRLAEFTGIDFMVAPNFSLYGNFPRMDNLFRIKQKWVMLERMQARGIRVIPDICYLNRQDMLNQLAWMKDNKVTCFAFNLQLMARHRVEDEGWQRQLAALRYFREQFGDSVRALIWGGTKEKRLRSLVEAYPNVTFMDARSGANAEFETYNKVKGIGTSTDRWQAISDAYEVKYRDMRTMIGQLKGRDPYPALADTRRLALTDGLAI